MNLKKSFMGTVTGLALIGSIAAPMASAQVVEDTSNNTTTAVVDVFSSGVFDAKFNSGMDFGDATFSASDSLAETLTSPMVIHYDDTYVDRPVFRLFVAATDFTSGSGSIPATGFTIVSVENVIQTQWGGVTAGHGDIGDIGQTVDNTYVAQSGGWPKLWTPGAGSQMNDWRYIQFGWAGVGTIESWGQVNTKLVVPPTTPAGHYQSTVTLTVQVGTAP